MQAGALSLRRASSPRAVPIELCVALANYFNVPINRDALGNRVDALLRQQQQLNLVNLGQLLDALGLRVMLTELPAIDWPG